MTLKLNNSQYLIVSYLPQQLFDNITQQINYLIISFVLRYIFNCLRKFFLIKKVKNYWPKSLNVCAFIRKLNLKLNSINIRIIKFKPKN